VRRLPGEHFVQHRAEGVHVTSRGDLFFRSRLFGTHVVRRTERKSRLGHASPRCCTHGERDTKVSDHRPAIVQENIFRLDVAMDHTVPVCVIESTGDIARDTDSFVDAKLCFAVEFGAQRLTVDERHDVEQKPVGRTGVEQRKDVGMLEARGCLDLDHEAFSAEDGCELGFQNFDGDLALVLEVVGEVDGSHSALAELADDAVAPLERRRQTRDGVSHRPESAALTGFAPTSALLAPLGEGEGAQRAAGVRRSCFMNNYCVRAFVALAATPIVHGAYAQQSADIPVRQVTILASTDSGVVANVYVVRVMSDGSMILNDASKRRLLLIDTSMKKFKVIADTAGESKVPFGNQLGGMLFFPGDSIAFVDRPSQALTMIDGRGSVGRTFSPPKAGDIGYFLYSATSNYGLPGFDSKGRLYYRGGHPPVRPQYEVKGKDSTTISPDSAPIVRADLDRRTIDTLAWVRIPLQRSSRSDYPSGGYVVMALVNPLPSMDDWAYFSDGTVAIVRAVDYHIEWIMPDGSRKSTPKMPFDWRRMAPDEKVRMVDSTAHLMDSLRTLSMDRAMSANGGKMPANSFFPEQKVVSADLLPDYIPPMRPGSQVRVDLDGNLWIMPSTSLQAKGGLLYDVVNRKGEIIERVQLPAGRNLHGFAPGGIVYLSIPGNMNAQFGWPRLEKAKVVR
jgi:hypothetical protein